MGHLFTIIIYQPFLNILVGIYWLLGLAASAGNIVANPPPADMGVAVIIFTIIIRILLLPLSISAERSEKERRDLEEKAHQLEEQYASQPILLEKEMKKLLRGNRRMVAAAMFDLFIQVLIALMLWRIFAKGLPGEDLHMIYSWMPKVHQPFNLVFLGKYDLTHPHLTLNILQSVLIFISETIAMLSSPFPTTRKEVVRMQFTLPVVSFMVFAFLPAGKKLFVITALCFGIVYQIVRNTNRWLRKTFGAPIEKSKPGEEPAIVLGAKPLVEPMTQVPHHSIHSASELQH